MDGSPDRCNQPPGWWVFEAGFGRRRRSPRAVYEPVEAQEELLEEGNYGTSDWARPARLISFRKTILENFETKEKTGREVAKAAL
jgi:hypothetical protein